MVTWDIILEKRSINKLNPEITKKNLRKLASLAEKNKSLQFVVKGVKIGRPSLITDQEVLQEKYLYIAQIRIVDTAGGLPEAARRRLDHVAGVIREKSEKSHLGWKIVDFHRDGHSVTAKEVSISARDPFRVSDLTPQHMREITKGIYNRDAHVRLIHQSMSMFALTKGSRRSHILLHGPPGACKTTLFNRMKEFYERDNPNVERIATIDGPTLTKAGLEIWLMEKIGDGILPEVLFLEEIEKMRMDDLLCLLSVMGSGYFMRVNARTNFNGEAPIVIWATCNDLDLLKAFRKGSLYSRFTHRLYCPLPNEKEMRKILEREVMAIPGGDPRWIDPVMRFAVNTLKTKDPREIIGLLDGRERILTGEYFEDKRITMLFEENS